MAKKLALIVLLWAMPACAQEVPRLEWIRMKYDEFNLLWFDGKLPKPVIQYTSSIELKAITTHHDGKFFIRFAPMHNLSETTTVMHLLHEMCHVDTWYAVDTQMDRHEKSWQGCMHRLADRGAFNPYW